MAASKHGPVRDKIRIGLEDDLYRLAGKNPRLGSGVQLDLAVGEGGAKQSVSPTLDRICWHFGMYDVIFRRIQESVALGLHRYPWEYAALRAYQRQKLENKYLTHLREYWSKRYYFYCVPPPLFLQKDLETGELINELATDVEDENEGEMKIDPSRTLVLAALPVDAKDAADFLKLRTQDLEELAPQVSWLVLKLIGNRIVNSRADAEARLTSWLPYLTKHTHQLINERVRGHLA